MSEDMVTLRRDQLMAIFDLAVGSMDFGSGFWCEEDVMAGRAIAEVLGVDPITATPSAYVSKFPHAFVQKNRAEVQRASVDATGELTRWMEPRPYWCDRCNEKPEHPIHDVAS